MSAPATAATTTEPPQPDPVVTVSSLTKRYGELTAIEDLTFSLGPGTVTGFLGPNGAGKSTTLRLLLGLAEPTAGEARVFGLRYRELDDPARRIGAVLESNDFHPGSSGRAHLRALALAADISPERVVEMLELVELQRAADWRVGTYSLGMRQRLGLASALLGDPELLVLDEPANGARPCGRPLAACIPARLCRPGGTVVISSHVLAEVAQTVDQVVIIDRGRLLATARLDELTRSGETLEDTYLKLTATVPA